MRSLALILVLTFSPGAHAEPSARRLKVAGAVVTAVGAALAVIGAGFVIDGALNPPQGPKVFCRCDLTPPNTHLIGGASSLAIGGTLALAIGAPLLVVGRHRERSLSLGLALLAQGGGVQAWLHF